MFGELDVQIIFAVSIGHDAVSGAVVVVKVLLIWKPGHLLTEVTLDRRVHLGLDHSTAPRGYHNSTLGPVVHWELELLL